MRHEFNRVLQGNVFVEICKNCGTIKTYENRPLVSRPGKETLVEFYQQPKDKNPSVIEPKCSDETKETKKIQKTILDFREQGYTFAEIEKKINLSEDKVYRLFQKMTLSEERINHIEIKKSRRREFKRLARTKPELFNKNAI